MQGCVSLTKQACVRTSDMGTRQQSVPRKVNVDHGLEGRAERQQRNPHKYTSNGTHEDSDSADDYWLNHDDPLGAKTLRRLSGSSTVNATRSVDSLSIDPMGIQ